MVANESPSYARVVLGEALRRKREELGLDQTEVARWLGQRQPKIHRLEHAQLKKIDKDELDIVLNGLGVAGEEAEELRRYAQRPYAERGAFVGTSRNQSWNGKARAETLASQYWSYHTETWDGLTQCLPYMRRQFELHDVANIDAAVKRRQGRQSALIYEADSPAEFQFVVSDAALHRDMARPLVLAEQLEHVLDLITREFVSVQVVPTNASIATHACDYTIMKFESHVMTDLVLLEHGTGALTLDEPEDLRRYERMWATAVGGALSRDDSRKLIRERIGQLRATKKEK